MADERKVLASQMRCYRRIRSTCWKDKVTEAAVRDKVNRRKNGLCHRMKTPVIWHMMGMVGDSRLQGRSPRRRTIQKNFYTTLFKDQMQRFFIW